MDQKINSKLMKKLTKVSSIFLAALLVFSCFVWNPVAFSEEKESAELRTLENDLKNIEASIDAMLLMQDKILEQIKELKIVSRRRGKGRVAT